MEFFTSAQAGSYVGVFACKKENHRPGNANSGGKPAKNLQLHEERLSRTAAALKCIMGSKRNLFFKISNSLKQCCTCQIAVKLQ